LLICLCILFDFLVLFAIDIEHGAVNAFPIAVWAVEKRKANPPPRTSL
jgi:hypothetical protein